MNSEPRLSDSTMGDSLAGAADEPGGRDSSGPKGFFGRFLGVLTGHDDMASPDGDDQPVRPGMVNLRRLRVDDVAVPKAELVTAPVTIALPDLVEMFREHGFSRVPVYEGTLDSPLGMIHMKDLALKHGFGQQDDFDLRAMLRPLLYVPPSMAIGVLLQQMQQKRIHMALVIDEFGGVDGLVTIEDLIEQVVGEIEDEHDDNDDESWFQEGPGQWLIHARTPLDEIEAETGLHLFSDEEADGDIDTIGGLLIALAGRVPAQGEVITHESGAGFEIVEADPRRVKRVRMRLPEVELAAKTTAEAQRLMG